MWRSRDATSPLSRATAPLCAPASRESASRAAHTRASSARSDATCRVPSSSTGSPVELAAPPAPAAAALPATAAAPLPALEREPVCLSACFISLAAVPPPSRTVTSRTPAAQHMRSVALPSQARPSPPSQAAPCIATVATASAVPPARA
eukprot:16610-Chlamydomonas_euryale.AAC.13